nr:hypothetical protein [Tanacetum cinerariifolium]
MGFKGIARVDRGCVLGCDRFLDFRKGGKEEWKIQSLKIISLLLFDFLGFDFVRIDNDIYSIVDACDNAKAMWIAIERLTHGDNINRQDVKSKLFWEFGRFTSKDRETLELYYLRTKGKEIVRAPLPFSESKSKYEYEYENWNNHQMRENENKRVVVVVGNKETVGQQIVQQTKIKCFNCNGLGTWLRSARQSRDNMIMSATRKICCYVRRNQLGGQLSAKEYNWFIDSNEEPEDRELEAHYIYMAKIQEGIPEATQDNRPTYDTKPMENV